MLRWPEVCPSQAKVTAPLGGYCVPYATTPVPLIPLTSWCRHSANIRGIAATPVLAVLLGGSAPDLIGTDLIRNAGRTDHGSTHRTALAVGGGHDPAHRFTCPRPLLARDIASLPENGQLAHWEPPALAQLLRSDDPMFAHGQRDRLQLSSELVPDAGSVGPPVVAHRRRP